VKNIHCLAATALFSAVFFAGAKADDTGTQTPSTSEILSLQDPDGVPFVISHPQEKQASQAEIDEAKKEQAQAETNKDWLLRSYEEQLRKRSSGQSGDESNNLYYRIASDKNLSKLAGLSTIAPPEHPTNSLPNGASNTDKNTSTLPSVSSLSLKSNFPPTSISLLKPLITPLGATDAAGLHNFYSTVPTAPAPAPSPKTDTSRISPDLDMPGKVAAENDPLSKASLTFDSVPDEMLPTKGPPHNDGSGETLPLSTNAEQLQKLNDAAMNVPGLVKTVTPVNSTSLQLKLTNNPDPIIKLTSPSPVRQPIASPFSILDR